MAPSSSAILSALAGMLALSPAGANARETGPVDPARVPPLPAPRGQIAAKPAPPSSVIAPHPSESKRVSLTLAPCVGRLKLSLPGHRDPLFGGGVGVDLETALTSWLWIRAGWQRVFYPSPARVAVPDSGAEPEKVATKGWLQWQDWSLSLRYAIDDGRVRPVLEAGLGWAQLMRPPGELAGQTGQACTETQACELGLTCIEGQCVRQGSPSAHLGLMAQWLLGRYFSTSVGVRYYGYLAKGFSLDNFADQWTVQLQGTLRY